MKKIKSLLLFSALLSLSSAAFALDFGGILTNDSKYEGNKIKSLRTDQKDSASLWFTLPLTDTSTSKLPSASLTVKGTYEYNYNNLYKKRDRFINTLDLDALNLKYEMELSKNALSISAGRFFITDLSSIVLSQNVDGISALISFPRMEISAFGAYTGFLNMHTITMLDEDEKDYKPRWLYRTAAKYALYGAEASFPYAFLNQSVALQGLGIAKLEKKHFYRFYATASLSGSFLPQTFYSICSTVGFKSHDDEKYKISNLSQISFSIYPEFKSAYIGLKAVYASGKNGNFKPFMAFSSTEAVNNLYSQEFTSLLKAGGEASIKIIEPLFIYAGGEAVFDAATSIKYDGFQYSAKCTYQIFSDLIIEGSFSQYINKSSKDKNNSTIQLKGTFTF